MSKQTKKSAVKKFPGYRRVTCGCIRSGDRFENGGKLKSCLKYNYVGMNLVNMVSPIYRPIKPRVPKGVKKLTVRSVIESAEKSIGTKITDKIRARKECQDCLASPCLCKSVPRIKSTLQDSADTFMESLGYRRLEAEEEIRDNDSVLNGAKLELIGSTMGRYARHYPEPIYRKLEPVIDDTFKCKMTPLTSEMTFRPKEQFKVGDRVMFFGYLSPYNGRHGTVKHDLGLGYFYVAFDGDPLMLHVMCGENDLVKEKPSDPDAYLKSIIDSGDLNKLAAAIHKRNEKWWTDLETGKPISRDKGELLMLVVTELAEATEGCRKNLQDDHLPSRKMEEVELADAKIRLLDFAGGFGITIEPTTMHWAVPENKGKALFSIVRQVTRIAFRPEEIRFALRMIEDYCAHHKFDLNGAMFEKLIYNAKRTDHSVEARKQTNGKKF